MKDHFSKMGFVTDVKIMRKGTRSRMFGFIGFKTDAEAEDAKRFFDSTYIDTSKIEVDFAKSQNDPMINRPWSKYSAGSSAYQMKHGKDQKKAGMTDQERQEQADEINRKK